MDRKTKHDLAKMIRLTERMGLGSTSKLFENYAEEIEEASKPDFLDLDKDGDKTEPMKDAAKEDKDDDSVEEGKKKALAIFYCSTLEQVEQLKRYGKCDSTDVRNTIEQKYARLGEYWGVKIQTIFLRYE